MQNLGKASLNYSYLGTTPQVVASGLLYDSKEWTFPQVTIDPSWNHDRFSKFTHQDRLSISSPSFPLPKKHLLKILRHLPPAINDQVEKPIRDSSHIIGTLSHESLINRRSYWEYSDQHIGNTFSIAIYINPNHSLNNFIDTKLAMDTDFWRGFLSPPHLFVQRESGRQALQQRNERIKIRCQKTVSERTKSEALNIIDPSDPKVSAEERTDSLLSVLYRAYQGSHISASIPREQFVHEMKSGKLNTWIMTWNGHPVATASIKYTKDGKAILCYAAAVPKGTPFYESADMPEMAKLYDGSARASAVQYQRYAKLLQEAGTNRKIWTIESSLRLDGEIETGHERTIPSGIATQHVNRPLSPMLLCIPRHRLVGHPRERRFLFMVSRMDLMPQLIIATEPIFTPVINPTDLAAPTIAEIINATYAKHYNVAPTISRMEYTASYTRLDLVERVRGQRSTLRMGGALDIRTIREVILNEFAQESGYVQIEIVNSPQNVGLQRALYNLGAVPLGVLPELIPGAKIDKSGFISQIHFGIIRPDLIGSIPDIVFADHLVGTEIESVTRRLHKWWKNPDRANLILSKP